MEGGKVTSYSPSNQIQMGYKLLLDIVGFAFIIIHHLFGQFIFIYGDMLVILFAFYKLLDIQAGWDF
jgi:hypothetical protein